MHCKPQSGTSRGHLAPVTGKRRHNEVIGLLPGTRGFFFCLCPLQDAGLAPNPWAPRSIPLQCWVTEGEAMLGCCIVSLAVSYYPVARHKDINTDFFRPQWAKAFADISSPRVVREKYFLCSLHRSLAENPDLCPCYFSTSAPRF